MTDNSLPTSSSSVPFSTPSSTLARTSSAAPVATSPATDSSSNSYVDSYIPPSLAQNPSPVSANLEPVVDQTESASDQVLSPNSPKPSQPKSDPLAELEKALQEYETLRNQEKSENKKIVEQVEEVKKSTADRDPLMELEEVLNKYEDRYRQNKANSTNSLPSRPVSPVPDQMKNEEKKEEKTAGSDLNDSDERTISQEEYRDILKSDSVKLAEIDQSTNEPVKRIDQSTNEPIKSVEPIEEQNIFELLGVIDADQADKEAFLDELQQALWDDFLDKDLPLLVKPEQLEEIQQLRQQDSLSETELQSQLIAKVEELVPDVEEIILEKALELKEVMIRERLIGLKQYFTNRASKLDEIQKAEQEFSAERWKTGAQILNNLTA
ncbi:MAG: hypothetical protein A2383_03275 [Candidatus Pacebacteria bacterium RIFOXYB1_FULL_39_46]|nr:MAG: hypothetical protein A2182_01320 [Candidatus Pacebacteria bacterium RIFOXYA1_FULL_38_18]OGJ38439.1 MAG: hypothetical protein A2383_03275 [Candidatus Pacebacteria bacterium RIFOXYB1_FULL_39_46]OGJ40299.1 MAG: hypothetical protein A2411_03415 [Candidatus Pacebacteria bacterium RIFOXYC1_FULL_39_21]OGJ40872.1 MAG: hypothetical protein A2582_02155 [Candidatus Pacebacteria bacterium RIFOXYD1_FULL_39_27]